MTQIADHLLRTTLTSPFGRKVRLGVLTLGLGSRVETIHADLADPDDPVRRENPLGKIPSLLCPDGSTIHDSPIILEYLQDVAQNYALVPLSGKKRHEMMTAQRVADGIVDAGALIIYEARYHRKGFQSAVWLDHQQGKIRRALAWFEASPPDPSHTDVATIALSCALEFLDRRRVAPWRADAPKLVVWYDRFCARELNHGRTLPPPSQWARTVTSL